MTDHLPFATRNLFIRTALAVLLAVMAPVGASARQAGTVAVDDSSYRLFLTDGTAVAIVGEFARVGERVVFSIAPGNDATRLQVVTLPVSAVDWDKTDLYVKGIRAAHYATTRGETDYAALTADVARALNRAAISMDPFERLQTIEQARGIVVTWGRDHFAYRADDVRRIELMLDDMVSEMRARAGIKELNLELVANVEPPPPVQPLPKPSLKDSIEQVLRVADASDNPSERLALRQAALKLIDGATRGALSAEWAKRTRTEATDAVIAETRVERAYKEMRSTALARAISAAARADSAAVEQVLADVQRRDERLGRKRPDEVSALVAAIDRHLESARRLRLARDKWRLSYPLLRDYQRLVRQPMRQVSATSNVLEAIRKVSGPDVETLISTKQRLERAARIVRMVTAPADVASVHATLVSACQMALRAAEMREKAIQSGNLQYAWDASSAASGALILLSQARAQLDAALKQPELLADPAGAAK